MTQVVPAIIPSSFSDLEARVSKVESFAPLVQVDILDGAYAPAQSWPFVDGSEESFEKIKNGEVRLPFHDHVFYEADLMVRAPEVTLDTWIQAGFSHLIIHIESTNDLGSIISRLKTAGRGIGLALKPSTALESVTSWIEHVDFVQCMGSDKIGYHGVTLDDRVVGKIADLRSLYPELIIAVDIGVTMTSAPQLVKAGASKLVSGSAIFDSESPQETFNMLSSLA